MNINQTMSIVAAVLLAATLPNYSAVAEEPASGYPLTTCVVSGMRLGSMGAPYVHKVGDTEVRFCCKACLPKFEKNPEGYLKKLSPKDTYPLKTCVVSGEPLQDGYLSTTYEGQEVRLCCKGCRKDFHKSPEQYIRKLREAGGRPAAAAPEGDEHKKKQESHGGHHHKGGS